MGAGTNKEQSPLIDSIIKDKNWLDLDILQKSTSSDRVEIITQAFRDSTAHYDDDRSLRLFELLLQAIQEEDKPNDGSDIRENESRLAVKQARYALVLYPDLPRFKPEPPRYVGDQPDILLTLLKTRGAMTNAILGGWKFAPTDEDADIFFVAVCDIDKRTIFTEEKSMIHNALKAITGSAFPVARIIYTMRTHPNLYESILGHAWVIHCGRGRYGNSTLSQVLVAAGLLCEALPETTEYAGKIVAELLEMDRFIKTLNKPLSTKFSFIYEGTHSIKIVFSLTTSRDEEFHRSFEENKATIASRKTDWPAMAEISLVGRLLRPFRNEVVYERKEQVT
jgi:hypothetical protein